MPLVTVIALAYAGLLEGAVLTETVFAWPGLGHYLTISLLNADMNAVLGATLVIGCVYIGLNLLADLAYRLLDPARRDERARNPRRTRAPGCSPRHPASRRQAAWGALYRGWRRFRRNRLAHGRADRRCCSWSCSALAAPLLAPYNPDAQDLADRLRPPSRRSTGSAPTSSAATSLPPDLRRRASRSAWWSRWSCWSRPSASSSAASPAILGGWADRVLMRITDIFLAFPRLILALAFVAALGPGIENAVIAIALTAWPPYARLARAETLTIRDADFIAAVRLTGASASRIVLRHIVPLCPLGHRARHARHGRHHPHRRGPGLPRPGRAAAAAGMGHDDRHRAPLHARPMVGGDAPGIAIFIAALAFNLLGDGLRDVLDPKSH